jgi:hypothetical protein
MLPIFLKLMCNCDVRFFFKKNHRNIGPNVGYALKVPKTSIWAGCNVLHQKVRACCQRWFNFVLCATLLSNILVYKG